MAGAACARAPRGGDFERYLEAFDEVRASGEDLYLQASVVAEQRADASSATHRAALEARLEALRLVARYNRLLTGLARGEDPKILKSEMNAIGSKMSGYKPSPQVQAQLGLTAAIPYLGIIVQGAGLVKDELAKRRFIEAVHAAEKPIGAIVDILLADSKPLETLLVEHLREQQDPYRAEIDALGGRFYRAARSLKASPALGKLVARHDALRARSGRPPVPHEPAADAVAPTASDLELLGGMVDEVETSALASEREAARQEALRRVFARYRGALEAAKQSLAALNARSDEELAKATDAFSDQALDLRRETVRLKGESR